MAKEYPIQNVSFRGETDNFLTEAGVAVNYQSGLTILLFPLMQKGFMVNWSCSQNYFLMQIERCLCLQRLH